MIAARTATHQWRSSLQGSLKPTPAGTWLRYDGFGPPLAAYMPDLKKGPVSIVWKGHVSASQLRDFFVDASKRVCGECVPYYRTRVLMPTKEDTAAAWDVPPLENFSDFRFVRFECAWATARDREEDRAPSETAAALVSWASLDEPADSVQESVGVYSERDAIKVLLGRIADLVATTAIFSNDSKLEHFKQVRTALEALKSDLAEAVPV
jgi:hypothetical protein